MTSRLLLLLLLVLASWDARAQTQIGTAESFETDGEGVRYTSTAFDLRSSGFTAQYFVREDNPVQTASGSYTFGSTSNPAFPPSTIPNVDGTFFWASEGARGQGLPALRPPQTVTLNSRSVVGYNNLQVKVRFADARGAGYPLPAVQWENDDYVRVKVSLDGGAFTTIGQFVGDNPAGATAGNLRQDLNRNGQSSDNTSAPVVTQTLTDFTFVLTDAGLAGSGSTIRVQVEVDTNGGTEELAFDYIRVLGTASATQPPVLANIEGATLTYNEGAASAQITNSLTVSDADNTSLAGATVSISTGFTQGQDYLRFTTQNGISGSYNSTTGVLTLTGSATLSNYQAALRTVRYENTDAVTAIGGNRLVTFTANDGTNSSNGQSRTIFVNAQLNAPASLPYTEDFEGNGEGLRYSTDTWSTTSPCLGYLRTNANPYSCAGAAVTNISGSYYWYAEATSSGANPNPVDIGTMTLAPVNATNTGNLHFNIRLGVNKLTEWENDDYVRFYYRVNGGSWVLFGAFYGDNAGFNVAGELRRDADLNGVADAGGTSLTLALQNIDFALPPAVTGASVDFQILINSDGQEELSFDRINITGTLNNPPTIANQAFSVAENAANGTVVGTVSASAADAGQSVTYAITGGNTNGAFAINASSGQLTVANSGQLNFEATTSYALTVQATDNGVPAASTSATVTVSVTNVNEAPGAVTDANAATNTVAENAANGTAVGLTATATDPDAGATLTYSLTNNAGGRFAINTSTGLVTVANGTLLDFETATSHAITVQASDGALTSSQSFIIQVTDVDEIAPTVISVGVPANGSYTTGQNLTVTVTYSEAVTVNTAGGTPSLSLTIGSTGRSATYLSGTGTSALTFRYTVQAGELDNNGIAVNSPLALNGGTIRDAAGNNAVLNLNGVAATTGVLVDAVAPTATITTTASNPTPTSPIPVTVTFSENVSNFIAGDVVVGNGTVVGASFSGAGSTYTFNVTPTTAGGVTVNVPANVAQDGATNGNTAAPQLSLTYTPSATVTAVTRLLPSPTATTTATFSVTFSGTVTGLTPSNFTLATTGLTGAGVSSVSGSGSAYTVTVNTGTGEGTLRLDVANATGVSPTLSNVPYTSGQTYTVTRTFTTPILSIQGTGGSGGDVTAFVDRVQLLNASTNALIVGAVANPSFEKHNPLANGAYGYNPTGARWTFNAQSGIANNGSAFGPPPTPDSIAVAFLQALGQVQQSLISPAGTFRIGFQASQRFCCNSAFDQALNVFINGVYVGRSQPANNNAYTTFTSAAFTVNAVAPTDLALTNNSVAENAASGTTVGTLSTTSPTPGETYSYSLVGGAGSTGNTSFTISGSTLQTATTLNFEAQSSYSVRVRTTNAANAGLSVEKVFTIAVTNVNETPLTPVDNNQAANAVAESAANGTTVGLTAQTTDPDAGAALTYSLTNSAGGRFAINATTGVVTVANGLLLDFEAAASHTITVQASDGALASSQSFTIQVTNVNEQPGVPTDANAAANTVPENAANGTSVGLTASSLDPDGTAPTYSLTNNAGGRFTINTTTGVVTVADGTLLDFETATSHAITVEATDGALSASQSFTIQVTNVNEAPTTPTDANAAANTVPENAANGTSVGITASSTDPDAGASLTYSLTNNAGGRFAINGSTGVVTVANGTLLDFETATSHAITVQASDGTLASSQSFTIQVTDVDDTAPDAPVVTTPADGSVTNSTSPTVTGTAEASTTIQVYVDNVAQPTTTATGAGSWSATITGPLADGSHTVRATATDAAGNISADSDANTFTVDTTPPNTTITSAPPVLTNSPSATFEFSGSDAGGSGVASFEASLDGAPYAPASSPQTYTGLSEGAHTFEVRAVDAAGNADSSPASFEWTIDTTAPTVTITSTASNPTIVSPIPLTVTTDLAAGGQLTAAEVTVSNGSVGTFADNADGTYTLTIVPAAAGLVTVSVAASAVQDVAGNGNAAASFSITYVLPITSTAWTGAVSTGWFNGENWTEGVPTPTLDAAIPAGAPRYPAIGSGSAVARNLLLEDGASLTMSGGTLDLTGDWTNNGTFTATGGTVAFSTANAGGQTSGGASESRYWNLSVGPNGVTLGGPAAVQRMLTLTGTLTTSGQPCTLLSDAGGTALVINAGGVAVGHVTVQRYLTPGTALGVGYRHLSTPVSGSTVADLAITGFVPKVNPAYNAIPAPALQAAQFPNVLGFDETRGGPTADFGVGYFSPASLASALVPGRGYSVYMKPLTPDFVGTLTTGDVTVAGMTRTGTITSNVDKPGWQLLGNPYPSPIDWDLVSVPTGMSPSISVYKSTGGNSGVYLTRANGLGSLTDGLVAMGQAFFGRVTGTGPVDFTFTNALRSTSYVNPAHYRPAADPRPMVQFTLRGATAPAAEQATAFVYFQAGATAGLDDTFDGPQPGHNLGAVPTLVSLTASGEELAVNGLPETALTSGTTVELLLDLPAAGAYVLEPTRLANLPGAVALLDRLTSTRYDLTTTPSVRFTAAQAGAVSGRFALEFNPSGTVTGTSHLSPLTSYLTVYPNPARGTVRVSLPAEAGRVELLDATGRVVRRQTATGETSVSLTGLPAGVYTVRAGTLTQRLVVE